MNGEIRRLIEAAKKPRRDPVLVQRPSAYQYHVRDGKVEAAPVTGRPLDPVMAEALASEVREKAAKALAALTGNHADEDVTDAVRRLLGVLDAPADQIVIGFLLSRARTLAAHAGSYADAGGGRERSIRAVVTDLAATVDDLLGCYPGIQPINANRLALGLQDEHALDVDARLDEIDEVARASPAVRPSTLKALDASRREVETNEAALARTRDFDREAKFLGERGRKVAARLLDVTNFVSAPAQKLASELGGLGADTWNEGRKVWPKAVARGVAKGAEKGLEHLISSILAHWTAIASMVPSLAPHARKVREIADKAAEASGEAPDDEAPPPA